MYPQASEASPWKKSESWKSPAISPEPAPLWSKAAESRPNDIAALTNYAEFLQHYGDPGCREAYQKLLTALRQSGDSARVNVITKRIALLDLLSSTKPPAAADSAGQRPHSRTAALLRPDGRDFERGQSR